MFIHEGLCIDEMKMGCFSHLHHIIAVSKSCNFENIEELFCIGI